MIDQLTSSFRAIKLLNDLCRHVIGAKRMICPIEQVIGSHYFVTAFKRFTLVTHGIHIQIAQIIPERMYKAEWINEKRRWSAIRFNTALEVRNDASNMGHDQCKIGDLVEYAALDEE